MLRIRADSTLDAPRYLDTTRTEEECSHDKETAESEAWLRHVPDIQNFPAPVIFDWGSRSLVAALMEGTYIPKSSKGWWFMYKCNKAWDGLTLKENPFFEKDGKQDEKQDKEARVFGDVFIFRLKNEKPDQLGRARYATTLSVPEEEVAREIFISMAQR